MSKPARILLAEDDALVRETIAAIIENAGHAVTVAADGAEAWERLQGGAFDLLISDIRMPRMDGFELFERMRHEAEFVTIPVIFLSALAAEADVRQGMVLGASDYLTKPADPVELCRVVETRLGQRARMQQLLQTRGETIARYLPHELRTPLNGILGYAELMLLINDEGRALTREETRDFGQQIQISGRRLLRISDNMMLLHQLNQDSTTFPVGKDPTAWASALRTQARSLADDYGRGADLVCNFAEAELPLSSEMLVSAMVQLIDNGFKFSTPGHPVEVKGFRTDGTYQLQVRDKGRGMSAAQIARQAPFVQHDRAKYEQQGLGLGLEIVRRICARLALEFTLSVDPGEPGVLATIRIPLARTA
ncbi:MAG: hypothetical protein RIS54_1520 [Verrucomicrobiota bacterium]|jgi:two-component system sensor histidine kinase/response regulator